MVGDIDVVGDMKLIELEFARKSKQTNLLRTGDKGQKWGRTEDDR